MPQLIKFHDVLDDPGGASGISDDQRVDQFLVFADLAEIIRGFWNL
jgi:hypothetical protein